MRISSDCDVKFVLIEFQVIKVYVSRQRRLLAARCATHLENLATKEIFSDWKQSESGVQRYLLCC